MKLRKDRFFAGLSALLLGIACAFGLLGCTAPAERPMFVSADPIHAFREMRPLWVDVLVFGAKPGTHREDIVAALVDNMSLNVPSAAEIADLILAGQKVDLHGHSHEQAALMAEALEKIGLEVDLKVAE
jgi:hypothetical protein